MTAWPSPAPLSAYPRLLPEPSRGVLRCARIAGCFGWWLRWWRLRRCSAAWPQCTARLEAPARPGYARAWCCTATPRPASARRSAAPLSPAPQQRCTYPAQPSPCSQWRTRCRRRAAGWRQRRRARPWMSISASSRRTLHSRTLSRCSTPPPRAGTPWMGCRSARRSCCWRRCRASTQMSCVMRGSSSSQTLGSRAGGRRRHRLR
jgi:hypothetical protein